MTTAALEAGGGRLEGSAELFASELSLVKLRGKEAA